MKAVSIRSFGEPEGLSVVDLTDPRPAAGEVLVSTEAIGVGGVDRMIRSGALAGHGFAEGHILGGEVAGTVLAVGDGVDESWVGRRVWAFLGLAGGYAELAVAPIGAIVALPDDLGAAEAVSVGSSGIVAHFGLGRAGFVRGDVVMVRGAAGSLGTLAVQLAVRGGASAVAVTASSPDRGERLRKLGATHVLDRSGAGAPDAPASFDVIVDIVAGPELPSFFAKLSPNGRMVLLGAVAGPPPADFGMALFAAFQNSISVATFSANPLCITEAARASALADIFAATARGELQAPIHEVLPLEQAVLAHQKLDAGEVFGRLVLTP